MTIQAANSSIAAPSSAYLPPAKRKYEDWRRSGLPEFNYHPLQADLSGIPKLAQPFVEKRCIEQYKRHNRNMDQAIADTALLYVYEEADPNTKRPGPLMKIANQISQRTMDLYAMLAIYEICNQIPLIPVDAGQLKSFNFTSKEILQMQESCKELMKLIDPLERQFSERDFEECFKILVCAEKRKDYLVHGDNLCFREAIKKYNRLAENKLIDRACIMMFKYGLYTVKSALLQLSAIASMKPMKNASLKERMFMEMRHRICGDGSNFTPSPGSLGSSPLAYYNLIMKGEPEHLEAEFRNRMYFIYKSDNLVNEFMQNQELCEFANQHLSHLQNPWQVDLDFVEEMNRRGPEGFPPLFRLGPNASLNSHLREYARNRGFYRKHPLPLLSKVMNGACRGSDATSRHPLSSRELFIQIGKYEPSSIDPKRRINMPSGGAYVRLKKFNEIDDSPQGMLAKEYLGMCGELGLTGIGSISGTTDIFCTIAKFAGIEDLQTVKLALIAFMVPPRDHSVHEILQSATSLGELPYLPRPGYENDVYPIDNEKFQQLLKEQLAKRGTCVPSYFLSSEFAKKTYENMRSLCHLR